MENWEIICSEISDEGWIITHADPPAHDPDDVLKFINLCRENTCGMYGKTWACPPGWTLKMDALGERFDSALILERCFHGDPHDDEKLAAGSRLNYGNVRRIVTSMRAAGIDAMGFADGECTYCGVCAYPEPCRFPEQLVGSVSAMGVDLGKYMASVGRPFEFSDDSFTLYSIILYKRA